MHIQEATRMPKHVHRKRTSRPAHKASPAVGVATSDISGFGEISALELQDAEEGKEGGVELPVVQVESLVAGRQKRVTAGNRLATLLDKEASKDDELELLFAESGDDIEFEVEEDEGRLSDIHLESSDEEGEDGGGDGEQEDLPGEAELQAEVRAEKAKKRKAPETFFKPPKVMATRKKKVTIVEADLDNPTVNSNGQLTPSDAALNKHRKKSERISWIPTEGPTRSSSRKLSLQNRAVTHQRLKESEARRLHTIALMEAAAKKKQKENPKKGMTQVERLEEAKKTELMNKKSLNSWEESEAARVEQQRVKLAALHSRKMNGAVLSWWSGQAEWDEKGRLVRVGKKLVEEIQEGKEKEKEKKNKGGRPKGTSQQSVQELEFEKKGNGQMQGDLEGGCTTGLGTDPEISPNAISSTASQHHLPAQPEPQPELKSLEKRQIPSTSGLTADTKLYSLSSASTSNSDAPLLDGILYYASLSEDPTNQANHLPLAPPVMQQPLASKPHYSTRNLVVLRNFEESQVQSREGLSRVLFTNDDMRHESTLFPWICYPLESY